MPLRLRHLAAAFCAALALAGPVRAQTTDGAGSLQQMTPAPQVGSPILVLNQERLLSESLYGARLQREAAAARSALLAENRVIESQLTEEELRLTELRRNLPAAEFAPFAEEFDTRVEAIRNAQEIKGNALQSQTEAAQTRFFELAFPVLLQIVRTRNAAVLMDSRSVLLSAEGVDITELALEQIDAEIGEGGEAPLIDLEGAPLPDVGPEDPPTPTLPEIDEAEDGPEAP